MDDVSFIRRTLSLAKKASGLTSPNPMVGAVLVRNGQVIAEDFHKKPGTPHAEALVIAQAGEKTRGSTLYVNLEPCCHTDKRTPPCTKAILGAGISRVVVAMNDPNPKVSGMGLRELERAGIMVSSGILQDEARRLNESYIKYITTGMPFVVLKAAMTLDGKIATPAGQSKWITGEKARKTVHRLRSSVDAIITAIGTVKADDPQMTARIKGGKNPIRIVIDPGLEIPPDARVLKSPPETIVVTKEVKKKADCLNLPESSVICYEGTLNLKWLLGKLGERHITSVLIEGGSSLNAHALSDGVVDKVMFFISPKIIGGKDSFPVVGGKTFRRLEEAYTLRDVSVRRVGGDILVEGYVNN
ncbi:MAG TPA: bifunctional diaminohydroxyphosphoribosylaminopyrimidine deaminase/5-amino-6-(5-phosphoribosylamino)uracil reductase RibD [Thermodesulfovibrionales bacterium]|nr:bifunctional diaminohydroxyphosphoribosylaminopyrimidine deaminase/5-amino-6-(5-phosphoribosylamino)uracil reductase RibD [Thermodesulfovibrionales bacterium]